MPDVTHQPTMIRFETKAVVAYVDLDSWTFSIGDGNDACNLELLEDFMDILHAIDANLDVKRAIEERFQANTV